MDAFFSGKKNRGSIKRGRESWQSTTTQQIQIVRQGGDRTKNHNTKRMGAKLRTTTVYYYYITAIRYQQCLELRHHLYSTDG